MFESAFAHVCSFPYRVILLLFQMPMVLQLSANRFSLVLTPLIFACIKAHGFSLPARVCLVPSFSNLVAPTDIYYMHATPSPPLRSLFVNSPGPQAFSIHQVQMFCALTRSACLITCLDSQAFSMHHTCRPRQFNTPRGLINPYTELNACKNKLPQTQSWDAFGTHI